MRMIFVNLPVKDLGISKGFFSELGFEFNPEFSDDSAECMIVDDNIFVMLLVEDRFKDFINDEIADARRTTEVITGLSADSRQQVDELVGRAIGAGGKPWRPPIDEGPCTAAAFRTRTVTFGSSCTWSSSSMARYVRRIRRPVPKSNVDAYRRMARKAGKVWREHGALEYRECVADDVKPARSRRSRRA